MKPRFFARKLAVTFLKRVCKTRDRSAVTQPIPRFTNLSRKFSKMLICAASAEKNFFENHNFSTKFGVL